MRALTGCLLMLAACGARPQPHRFASPMMGTATLPAQSLSRTSEPEPSKREEPVRSVRAEPIRVASMPRVREASAAAAAAVVASSPMGAQESREQLPAPHKTDSPAPAVQGTGDLRALVGRRDTREPIAAALGWARELGVAIEDDVIAWAERNGRLHGADMPPERGDILVFDRVNSDEEADLLGVVIARDERGVTEFLYLGGGVTRRGFVDATRPTTKRDKAGMIVNTFMRSGKRWPAKGSRYLAGEHLAHVIRARTDR